MAPQSQCPVADSVEKDSTFQRLLPKVTVVRDLKGQPMQFTAKSRDDPPRNVNREASKGAEHTLELATIDPRFEKLEILVLSDDSHIAAEALSPKFIGLNGSILKSFTRKSELIALLAHEAHHLFSKHINDGIKLEVLSTYLITVDEQESPNVSYELFLIMNELVQ